MQIYHASVDIEPGFDILDENRNSRLLRGKRVERPSGWNLFSQLRGQPIRCWACNVTATVWVATKGRNDRVGHPVLNLYAEGPAGIMLMTRDHIIPKSLGGVDDYRNLRPGCAACNEARGNEVDAETLRFAQEHPELIDEGRIKAGLEGLQRNIEATQARRHDKAEIEKMKKPFKDMGYI